MVESGRTIDFGGGLTDTVKADEAEASVLERTEPPGLEPADPHSPRLRRGVLRARG